MIVFLASALAQSTLGGPAHGALAELSVGLGLGDAPITAGLGWQAAVAGWWGRYDDAYAIGRRWSVGLRVRQDIQPQTAREVRTAPMLEVRRGIDLLVLGIHAGVAGGPLLSSNAEQPHGLIGGTARAFGGATWRTSPSWGVQLQVEAGVDVSTRAQPSIGVLLGVAAFAPARP